MLACVSDPDPNIITVAIHRILQIETLAASQLDFILPDKINWNAVEYHEMIEWLPEKISVPPNLQYWSEEQIKEGFERALEIPEYPCHNQSVERGVRLVSEASRRVYGHEEGQGYNLNTLGSRDNMHSFRSMKDFSS